MAHALWQSERRRGLRQECASLGLSIDRPTETSLTDNGLVLVLAVKVVGFREKLLNPQYTKPVLSKLFTKMGSSEDPHGIFFVISQLFHKVDY
jgi:hypothetical protein